MHAADDRKAHAQVEDSNQDHDKDRPDDGKFDRAGPTLVVQHFCARFAHR
jgi:hypothetical protein